jgi:hypothetical protein
LQDEIELSFYPFKREVIACLYPRLFDRSPMIEETDRNVAQNG